MENQEELLQKIRNMVNGHSRTINDFKSKIKILEQKITTLEFSDSQREKTENGDYHSVLSDLFNKGNPDVQPDL